MEAWGRKKCGIDKLRQTMLILYRLLRKATCTKGCAFVQGQDRLRGRECWNWHCGIRMCGVYWTPCTN